MFDATHLQNVQPAATVNVATNIQTREHSVGALEILWNLDFGTWNSPTNRKFRKAGLLGELQ